MLSFEMSPKSLVILEKEFEYLLERLNKMKDLPLALHSEEAFRMVNQLEDQVLNKKHEIVVERMRIKRENGSMLKLI